jgi:hypothetical protein
MNMPSFADLAGKLAAVEAAPLAAPNLDSSMRFAPEDLTDPLARIAEAGALAAARAAAVVSARRAIEAAYGAFAEGADPFAYAVEDDAWELADQSPEYIETHRQEALAQADEEDPESDDPDARVAIHAAHDLALGLHALLGGLRRREPDLDSDELREGVDEAETIEAARKAEAQTLARFQVAEALRRRVDAYGEALYAYLAAWPEEERGEEEERVRDLVFGE